MLPVVAATATATATATVARGDQNCNEKSNGYNNIDRTNKKKVPLKVLEGLGVDVLVPAKECTINNLQN